MIKPWQHGIPRHSRDVWLIAAAAGLCSSAFLGMMQLLKVLYVLRLGCGPELVGTLFAAGALSFSLSSLPGGALGARFGPRRMMIVASLALAVGLLQMTCIPQWVSAGVGLAATLALSAMWVPAFQVLQMEMAEPAWRSLVSGGNAMAMSLGFGSVSFTGGYIVAAVGYRPLFLVGTMMATGSALLVSLLARQQEMAAAPRQAEPLGVARG